MNNNGRLDLLCKSMWTAKDIQDYTGYAKSKAYQIMNCAKNQYNGKIAFSNKYVSTDSVMRCMNTTRVHEAMIIREAIKEVNND